MDERQTKIVEGAGLEESRVNQELLDFLNKWSFPALLVIALISGGYYVYQLMEQRRVAQRDDAFGQYAAVEGSLSPSVYSLTEIADQFEGVGSVAELARLRAADVHMDAVRTGVDPAEPDVELTQEDRVYRLEQAEGLYRRVYDAASADPDLALFAANAAFGLAAVAETRGDADGARQRYDQAKTHAEQAGYANLAAVAEQLMGDTDALGDPMLYSTADLPRMPFEPEPVSIPVVEELEGDLGVDSSLNLTPSVEGPGLDLPGVETPAVDTPLDEPLVEEPAVEEPATEPPASDPPADDPND